MFFYFWYDNVNDCLWQKKYLPVKGAKPDLLVLGVSGDLGAADLGLQILNLEYEVIQINPHIHHNLVVMNI